MTTMKPNPIRAIGHACHFCSGSENGIVFEVKGIDICSACAETIHTTISNTPVPDGLMTTPQKKMLEAVGDWLVVSDCPTHAWKFLVEDGKQDVHWFQLDCGLAGAGFMPLYGDRKELKCGDLSPEAFVIADHVADTFDAHGLFLEIFGENLETFAKWDRPQPEVMTLKEHLLCTGRSYEILDSGDSEVLEYKLNEPQYIRAFGYQFKIAKELVELLNKEGWEDTSWGNNSCPSFQKNNIQIWIDFDDKNERDDEGALRFDAGELDSDENWIKSLFKTEDEAVFIAYLRRLTSKD